MSYFKKLLLLKILIFFFFIINFLFNFERNLGYVAVQGESNGDFFFTNELNLIYIKNHRGIDFEVGEFPVRKQNGVITVHPVIKVIKNKDRVVGYITRGIKNEKNDPILFPKFIIGRAFRVFEGGVIEEDTRYTGN